MDKDKFEEAVEHLVEKLSNEQLEILISIAEEELGMRW